jgi:hypothetical protein
MEKGRMLRPFLFQTPLFCRRGMLPLPIAQVDRGNLESIVLRVFHFDGY